jgi:hypothetical protein
MTKRRMVLWAVSLLAVSMPAMAREVRISFPKGSMETEVKGSITGYATVDYILRARKGQTLKVVMTSDNASAYFNLFEPGKGPGNAVFFIGSTSGDSFSGSLPASGDYTVQVYLMRNAARRKEKAHYTLTIGVTGKTVADLGTPPASDAKVKGTPYHATGNIPCSMGTVPVGSTQYAPSL